MYGFLLVILLGLTVAFGTQISASSAETPSQSRRLQGGAHVTSDETKGIFSEDDIAGGRDDPLGVRRGPKSFRRARAKWRREKRKLEKEERKAKRRERKKKRRQKSVSHASSRVAAENTIVMDVTGESTPSSFRNVSVFQPKLLHLQALKSNYRLYHQNKAIQEDLRRMSSNLTQLWKVVNELKADVSSKKRNRRRERLRKHKKWKDSPRHVLLEGTCINNWNPNNLSTCLDDRGIVCGDKGTCDCGFCNCKKPNYGLVCQCNDHTCDMFEGILCGGPSRGQCRCGSCICGKDYSGQACRCYLGVDTCQASPTDKICSDNGDCKCGQCHCNEGYRGQFCGDAVYAAGVCERLKWCVTCALGRNAPYCKHCDIDIIRVENVEPSVKTCVMVSHGCLLRYSYEKVAKNETETVYIPNDIVCNFESEGTH